MHHSNRVCVFCFLGQKTNNGGLAGYGQVSENHPVNGAAASPPDGAISLKGCTRRGGKHHYISGAIKCGTKISGAFEPWITVRVPLSNGPTCSLSYGRANLL